MRYGVYFYCKMLSFFDHIATVPARDISLKKLKSLQEHQEHTHRIILVLVTGGR